MWLKFGFNKKGNNGRFHHEEEEAKKNPNEATKTRLTYRSTNNSSVSFSLFLTVFLYLSEAKSVHIVISVFSARGANLEDEQQRKYEQEQLTLPQFFEPAPSCISFLKIII